MRMRANTPKVKLEVRPGEREKFFPHEESQSVKRYQKRWDATFLEIFRTQLDKTLSNVVWPHSESGFEQEAEMTF